MTRKNDDNFVSPHQPALWPELSGLLVRLCDDELSASDWCRLNQVLDESLEARQYYLQYIAVHSALAATAGSTSNCSVVDAQLAIERMTLDRFVGQATLAPACTPDPSPPDRSRRWRPVVRWAASISAILFVSVAALWWAHRNSTSVGDDSSIVGVQHPRVADHNEDVQRLVAEVTYVSDSPIWQNPNGSYALNSVVRSGQRLSLERGQVELTYSSGTRLLLTGPSEFVVRTSGGKLRRGELVARVPEAGHGFTIETPHGKVVDLGTEFGVVVDDFGVSQVSVFEGKVETLPTGLSGETHDKIELTSGRAIQWTDRSVIPIDFRGRGYRRPGNYSPRNPFAHLAVTSIDEDFRGSPLDPERWIALGQVTLSPNGLRLGNGAGDGQRPYLLTAQEFDPSRGAITVICDLRFENARDAEHASFAILTRSSDQRSKSGTPWQDMLARSVRCRLTANPLSGEGLLEAGTKYEADRELANISWGGFSRPRPNTLYRLEMRDDGLSVSFTVSLAENPSIRKTITCRSLFRANQNYIALEGSAAGTTLVERLIVSQDGSLEDGLDMVANDIGNTSHKRGPSIADSSEQLADLIPTDAELLLKEEFRSGELDSTVWTTLGDVVMKDGQVQLGLPNDEQHIDTWRARAYLLTREQFDPTAGALTILGRVTFAENFLHGYGGSFAVMSRADRIHGSGPGWENSILRRGIRSNFWPAAFGIDHSLEIHEKPASDTIRLLTAEGFRISPSSRSYLFRVIDDGRSSTLTFVDASNPSIRKTVSHPTASWTLTGGHIGFESCWGSPVLLDSVRIFRSNNAPEQQLEEQISISK